jgi:PTS system glucose-specific IIA component
MAHISVFAPLDGTIVALEQVPDEVFALKMVGDGLAVQPCGQVALAPVSGRLVKLFEGGHAFGIALHDGVELIVHIGLDTIELQGQNFEKVAVEGQMVQAGDPIVRFDLDGITAAGKRTISPIVSAGGGTVSQKANGFVKAGRDVLFVLEV